jgi:hypothetical protein
MGGLTTGASERVCAPPAATLVGPDVYVSCAGGLSDRDRSVTSLNSLFRHAGILFYGPDKTLERGLELPPV